ncbi:MAG TPA: hypothetical protein VD840_00650 [Sinorhizobium sp.]|nr:hypothetical protein [Sinorhizobium sp.]
MSKTTKRDDVHLRRLKAEFPDLHDGLLAGTIPSLHKALVIAGLTPKRTRLEKLKNSWAKATETERDAFLAWLAAAGALPEPAISPGARSGEAPIASGRYLLPSAIAAVKAAMARRQLTPGDVMREMGFPSDDGRPLARALGRNASLRLAVIAALETWLRTNPDGLGSTTDV